MAHHYVRPPFRYGGRISEDYSKDHRARDIAPRNDDRGHVYAIERGTVTGVLANMEGGEGYSNAVAVQGSDGMVTIYAHVVAAVYEGQSVRLGKRIGRVDESGTSTGRHVHLARLPGWGQGMDSFVDILNEGREILGKYFTLSLKAWPAGELL